MAEAPPQYVIRAMRKDEIPQALEIWKETGMQEGTGCLDTWLQIDPEFCKVAVTPSGEVLGVCSGVIHHEDLAVFGLYAVKERYRGLGVGVKIWKACLDHIGDRNAAVNAVPGKLEIYRDRGGFPIEETEWCTVIYETEEHVEFTQLIDSLPGIKIAKISDNELPNVIEYDMAVAGYNREKIISLTVKERDTVAVVALDDEAQQRVRGYGVLKMSVQGCGLVGPLYADNQEIAELLLRSMMQSLPEAHGIALMSTSDSPGAKDIARKIGVPETEEGPRCYRKYKLKADLGKIYGQLDLNFSPF